MNHQIMEDVGYIFPFSSGGLCTTLPPKQKLKKAKVEDAQNKDQKEVGSQTQVFSFQQGLFKTSQLR